MTVVAAAVIGSAVVGGAVAMNGQQQQADIASQEQAQTAATNAQQLSLAQQQQNIATDQYNNWKTTYQPLEQNMVTEASQAGGAADQEQAAGAAGGAVRDSFAKTQQATARNLARMGVNPNSGRAMAVTQNNDANEALAEATAANNARLQQKNLGWAKREDVASLGRNLPSQASAALSAAQAGVNASGQLGLSTNNALLANATASNASDLQGIGSIAGMALKYGTGTSAGTGSVRQGLFSGNSTDALSNPNAGFFNQIATTYDP